ncbi:alpha/beta hydrolase [Segetibacter koreensis]|uniref:alpha/beta hydrolase n=1 Tax=Segetibacter koreensis TaxID=398037 RepID=UPI0003754910|nr:alpha/beta fold hydrolase [Segetibacter koreensis]
MKTGHFTRRRLIASLAMGSFVFSVSDPFSSFAKEIRKGKTSNRSDLLSYVDASGEKKAVTTLREWEIKRQQILDGMQKAMGKLPGLTGLPAFNIEIIEKVKEADYTRLTLRFTAAEKEKVPAYLYIPEKKSKKKRYPAMLALHETDEIGKMSVDGKGHNPNLAYAKELAQRGYVVIAPDYPGFGDLKGYDFTNDTYESGTMKSIFDNIRCIDFLQSREDVDPDRIGVIGHSLGGHNALFTAAFDTRLKVIISSCGWTIMDFYNAGEDVTKRYGGRLGPWAQDRYMPLLREKYKLDPKKIPFDFSDVIAALAPRAFFSNSPVNDGNFAVAGVRKGIEDVSEVYRFLGAEDKLELRYPNSQHDFPTEVREEAYCFINKIFGVAHT